MKILKKASQVLAFACKQTKNEQGEGWMKAMASLIEVVHG
jgi:hypothetical protein